MSDYQVKAKVFYTIRGELKTRSEKRSFTAADARTACDYVERYIVPKLATPAKYGVQVLSIKPASRRAENPMNISDGCDDCRKSPFQLVFEGGHNMRIEH
jgi:hypothetical protein